MTKTDMIVYEVNETYASIKSRLGVDALTLAEQAPARTINNPCEVDADGTITVDHGAAYGQQTWWLYTCLTANRTIDLNKSGCELPKPARRH